MIEDPKAFSAIADVYDAEYSSQLTIRLQRRNYWRYLDRYLTHEPRSILDMNCGTGTDAVHFIEVYPEQKHAVTGVDISSKMIEQFNAKAGERGLVHRMRGLQSPLQQIEGAGLRAFDLVTSNFGGLNCLSGPELCELAVTLRDRLTNPGAHLVAVVMPTFCMWETAYYAAKRNPDAAFRRWKKDGVSANIGGTYIRTYYYSPREFASFFTGFSVSRVLPLGAFLPPSYLDNFFRRHSSLARGCAALEEMAASVPLAARISDHFIIDLVKV